MATSFYYADQDKVELTPSTAFVALKLDAKEEADREPIMASVAEAEGMQQPEDTELIEEYDLLLVPTVQEADEKTVRSATSSISKTAGVQSEFPVYQMPNGETDEVMILIPQFRVQLKPDATREDLEGLNKKHNVEILESGDVLPGSFLLGVTDTAKKNALELANLYHESELTEYAEPDFVMKVRHVAPVSPDIQVEEDVATVPSEQRGDGDLLDEPVLEPSVEPAAPVNDPFFPQQWALQKMRVPQAWSLTKGRASIKIAIVDEGVQTGHPDLTGRIVSPYDAVGNDTNQEPNSWDGHGTACAGIAAATSDNGRGIAGVAPRCRVMPIRIAYSARPGANWTTTTTWIARGIIRAAQQGADVISNSWGGGAYSSTIRTAIDYARRNGRGGKGAVVISATGNSDRANGVIYPAKYTESLACGASNEWDQRKSRTSRDGETWWGSNYGPEVDFVAPGVHIYTTDLTSTSGYGSGSYVPNFNGTSSATPNAAGVAALILSVDPNLRQWEVRDILRLTARDLSPRGRDNQHGFGRVDALRAVRAAARLQSQVSLRLEFRGRGRECYMRFRRFRLYNSGLNRVRVNSFTLRSYDPSGREIDRFEYRPNPGGVMAPGLPGPGGDLRFDGLLLQAHGNRSRYSYRWRANWSYTYWRPSRPGTTPADTMDASGSGMAAAAGEEEVQEEVELTFDGDESTQHPSVTVEKPLMSQPATRSDGQETTEDVALDARRPVTITLRLE